MTHKFALGVLMAFVLAFGVQGIADAQTVSVTGDNAVTSASSGITVISAVPSTGGTPSFTRSFTIRVSSVYNGSSITINSPAAFPATLSGFSGTPTAVALTEVEVTSAPTETDADTNSGDPTPVRGVIADAALGTPINFANLGDPAGGGEDPDGTGTRGSWTFKVTYTVSAWGPYVVDVDSAGPSSGNTTAPTVTGVPIAAYVLQSKGRAASYEIDKATAADITQTPQTSGGNIAVQVTHGTANQGWVQVDLRITSGKLYPTGQFVSGSRIYPLNAANDNGYTSLSVFTATTGSISVRVNPDRDKTATVTAQISGVTGAHASHTVTYFYNGVTIERVSGNYQHAKEGDRLPQPLVVRVLDGTRPVRDQRVRFTASGGQLRSVTGSTFINETGSAEGTTAISIKTDGSGQAKVYLTVPTTAAAVTVNAEVAQTPPAVAGTADGTGSPLAQLNEQFTVFAVERDSATLSDLIINVAPPTPVENADPDRNDIYVTVTELDGTTAITAPVEVKFTVTGGQLYLNPALLDLDANSLRQSTDRPQYVTQLSLSTEDDGTIGTSNASILFVKVNSGIAEVRAEVVRSSQNAAVRTIQYVAGSIELEGISNNPYTRGALGGLRDDPFVVRATIGGRAAPGQIVKFELPTTPDPVAESTLVPVPGTKVFLISRNSFTVAQDTGLTPPVTSVPVEIRREETYTVADGSPIFVETDANGEAQVYLQMGTAGDDHTVTATLPVGSETVTFTVRPQAGTIAGELKKIEVPDLRPNDANLETLAVRAENVFGDRLPGVNIRWTTTHGLITHVRGTISNNQAAANPNPAVTSGQEIFIQTNNSGEAWVLYRRDPDVSSAQTVRAEIASEQGTQEYDFEIRHQTFTIGSGGSVDNDPTTRRPSLSLSTSTLRGSPGQQQSFIVYARNASGALQQNVLINLSSGINISGLPSSVISGQSVSITLPNSDTFITASTGTHGSQRLTVTVQAVAAEIVKVSGDSPIQTGAPGTQLSSAFVVQVNDSNGNPVPNQTVTFRVTRGGGTLSDTSDDTDSNGQARTRLTLGSSAGTNEVEARVSGVSTVITFTATAAAALVPTELVIDGARAITAELNELLDFTVQVVDQNDDGISGEIVTFRTTEGVGRFSPSVHARTNADGYARVSFTPRSSGRIEVEATSGDLSPVTFTITTGEPPAALVYVSGNNQSGKPGARLANPLVVEVIDENGDPVYGTTVSFRVTAGGGRLSVPAPTTNTSGRAQTVLTLGDALGDNTVVASVAGLSDRVTFTARTGAEVLVSAAQRPPLYWVDRTNGTLHRLVDEETEDLAPNMKGATNITVDAANGYIYWTAQTAQNKGAIRRAGLNGRGAQTLKAVSSLPMGIAVDSAGGIVYWTNARGNILSIPVAGGKVTNIAKNLSSPGPLALSNGVLYWGEETGSVRKLSLTAKPKKIENLATGLGTPSAIAIAKGKIYWIERGTGGGRLQRANLNGTGIQQLKTFPGGVPIGFTIDSAANRIYWTKSAGKIQRSNLAGKFVKDIVTGLPNPGSIAIGTAVADDAPVVRQPTQPTQPTQPARETPPATADTSQYDVNGDGAVNEEDVNQVVQAVAFKSGDMKYDLNGDGVVDAKDITAVVGATSSAGAAAPSLLTGIDVTLLDVTVLHEQIAVLLASGDRSLAAKQTLAYLQELLTLARPDETVLLANYPNPFNPETWIPYHLAESTDVRVNIYDAQGTLVHELTLGHQTAGYYTSRSRAAYWDGKNALGERVASGIYFYQLQTDTVSPMRKMVILK